MARIRTVKPEFWTNSTTGKLSGTATKLYIGLHNHADDYGVVRHDPDEFKVKILPYERGRDVVENAVDELRAAGAENGRGLIVPFQAVSRNDPGTPPKDFLWLPYFTKHQRVEKPGRPLLEGWNATTTPLTYADSRNDPGMVVEPSGNVPAGKERIGEEEEPLVDQGSTGEVWAAYEELHPKAVLTKDRRELIRRRLVQFDPSQLVAAIRGNHRDPHCNGENAAGKQYHDLALILRDADHIERYAAMATNGHRKRSQPEVWVDDRPAMDPNAARRLSELAAMAKPKEMPA